jgi:5-methylcytosine-specific restriction protein A
MAPRLRSPGWRVAPPAPRAPFPKTEGGKHAAHYQTKEHDAWAKAVKERDRYTCQDCGATGVTLVADHVIEIEDGGARLSLANGLTRCLPCHNRKTAMARRQRAAKGAARPAV